MDLALVEENREAFEALIESKRCRSSLAVRVVDGAAVDGRWCVEEGARLG